MRASKVLESAVLSCLLGACGGSSGGGGLAAHAGQDQVVAPAALVVLDGSGSTGPSGQELEYQWSQASGTPVTLNGANTARATFVAPSSEGALVFALRVRSGPIVSAPAEVRVVVDARANNRPPLVNAGRDQIAYRRAQVILQGSGWDPEGKPLTFRWTQVGGPAVTLQNPDAAVTSFAAPNAVALLELELAASDGVHTATDRVLVDVRNRAPVLAAPAISPAQPRTLDDLTVTATATDPDGDPLTFSYQWRRNSLALAGRTAATLPHTETTKGDVISVEVAVSDGIATVRGQASTTILDTPASIQFTAPTTVAHCGTMAFTATASDPDGDPTGAFRILHGPNGMTITEAGALSWTACLPMFDTSLDVSWSVGLTLQPTVTATRSVRVTDPARNYPLRRTGTVIDGNRPVAFQIGDFDGDGTVETLTATASSVSIVAREGTGYQQQWVYPFELPGGPISAATARDINNDNRQEIFVATGGRVFRLDGVTRRVAGVFELGTRAPCTRLELADLTANGDFELVCLSRDRFSVSNGRLLVLDAATFALRHESALLPLGQSIAIGNVDSDPALEIVTSGGHVFDGTTFASKYFYSLGFGVRVDTGNVDGVGPEEIIGTSGTKITAFRASPPSPLWEHTAANDVFTLLVTDVDGDGSAEVLTGDRSNVIGYRYNPTQRNFVGYFSVVAQGEVEAIAVGDVDRDLAVEYVWNAFTPFDGSYFTVAGGTTVAVRYRSPPPSFDDGFVGGQFARISPTQTGLVFGVSTTNRSRDGSRVILLDPVSGAQRVTRELGSNWLGQLALAVTDYDRDSVDEVFVASAEIRDGYFTAHNIATDLAEWTSAPNVGMGAAVVAADVNADTFADLISVTDRGYVEIFDVRNNAKLWQSTTIGAGRDVVFVDLDGDSQPELVAATANGLFVYGREPGTPITYL